MNTLKLQIRAGRTELDIYNDSALTFGWTATIISEVTRTFTGTYGDLMQYGTPENVLMGNKISFKEVTSIDNKQNAVATDPMTITYTAEVTIANPVSQIDFGKNIIQNMFAEQDTQLAGNAEMLRSKKAYNI